MNTTQLISALLAAHLQQDTEGERVILEAATHDELAQVAHALAVITADGLAKIYGVEKTLEAVQNGLAVEGMATEQ